MAYLMPFKTFQETKDGRTVTYLDFKWRFSEKDSNKADMDETVEGLAGLLGQAQGKVVTSVTAGSTGFEVGLVDKEHAYTEEIAQTVVYWMENAARAFNRVVWNPFKETLEDYGRDVFSVFKVLVVVAIFVLILMAVREVKEIAQVVKSE